MTAAAAVEEEFRSGAVFVTSRRSATRTTRGHAHPALEITRFPALPARERLARHLADTPLLLVLDNFEHVSPQLTASRRWSPPALG